MASNDPPNDFFRRNDVKLRDDSSGDIIYFDPPEVTTLRVKNEQKVGVVKEPPISPDSEPELTSTETKIESAESVLLLLDQYKFFQVETNIGWVKVPILRSLRDGNLIVFELVHDSSPIKPNPLGKFVIEFQGKRITVLFTGVQFQFHGANTYIAFLYDDEEQID